MPTAIETYYRHKEQQYQLLVDEVAKALETLDSVTLQLVRELVHSTRIIEACSGHVTLVMQYFCLNDEVQTCDVTVQERRRDTQC